MAGIFKFKQFDVDQSGCAMKVNTDGVLLAAFAEADEPQNILDIGTGTGVIALMLAQKFPAVQISAVEIDANAARTAGRNFQSSLFKEQLSITHTSFQNHFKLYPENKYDLIISNPPFYINSLESPGKQINLAKHTDRYFFEELIAGVSNHLKPDGHCWLILPVQTAQVVKTLLSLYNLYLNKTIIIHSFVNAVAHREILVFSMLQTECITENFTIYDEVKKYTKEYKKILTDFFIIF